MKFLIGIITAFVLFLSCLCFAAQSGWQQKEPRKSTKLQQRPQLSFTPSPESSKYLSEYLDLATAVSDLGTTVDVTLVIDRAESLAADLIVTSNIHMDHLSGAVITTNGYTMTIQGPVTAGNYQIYSAASGEVVFASGATEKVYLEWWGAVGDGSTDDSTHVSKAITATADTGIEIHLMPKTYIMGDIDFAGTGAAVPGTAGPIFVGHGDNSQWADVNAKGGTIFKAVAGADYLFKFGDATNYVNRGSFKNMALDGNGNASGGIYLLGGNFFHFENVVFNEFTWAIIPQLADRLTMTKCTFYSNTYAFYYDEDVQVGIVTSSGISLVDIHHRSNDYNLYSDGDRVSFQFDIRGGYWSSANIADVYLTGGAEAITFHGVNFENTTNGSVSTKAAYFQIGQVHGGTHIGLDLLSFTACSFADNNTLTSRPAVISVVDSTNASYPSIRVLNFSNNVFRNMASEPQAISSSSQVTSAYWVHNSAPSVAAPTPGTVWKFSNSTHSIGSNYDELYAPVLTFPQMIIPSLNRTAHITVRKGESGGVYTNEGATGTVIFTLPAVVVGYMWYFTTMETEVMRIQPQPDEGFTDGSGNDKYKDLSTTVGHGCLVIGVSATKAAAWWAIPLNGATLSNE